MNFPPLRDLLSSAWYQGNRSSRVRDRMARKRKRQLHLEALFDTLEVRQMLDASATSYPSAEQSTVSDPTYAAYQGAVDAANTTYDASAKAAADGYNSTMVGADSTYGGDQEQIRIVSQFRTLMSHCPAYV